MNSRNGDINDNEIRIISSGKVLSAKKRRRLLPLVLSAAALLLTFFFCMIFFLGRDSEVENSIEEVPYMVKAPVPVPEKCNVETPAYTSKTDTVVNGISLVILTPCNSTPVLEIGNGCVYDSTAVLIAQAADIRQDNGGIVGTFVVAGDLKGRGEAKAGFCSIVNGEVTVGVADATPAFEQAMTSNGYFFRQYPLVVGGQVVENKPRGKSVRRALAEISGKVRVVFSLDRLTYQEFSQALIDAGARNAVSIVGGSSYGRYVDAAGESFDFGPALSNDIEHVNFIVWR